jgi:hypothetical protein
MTYVFHCIMAKFIWGYGNKIFGLNHILNSVEKLFYDWGIPIPHMSHSLRMFLTAGLSWSLLWCNRNKMVTGKNFLKQSKNDPV